MFTFVTRCQSIRRHCASAALKFFLGSIFRARWLANEAGSWFSIESADIVSHELVLRHPYGQKWSRYVKSFAIGAHSTISNAELKVDYDDEFIGIKLPLD